MTRTYETEKLLADLIDAFQKDGHFIIRKGEKVFARIITDEDGDKASSQVCLSNIAALLAERLSK